MNNNFKKIIITSAFFILSVIFNSSMVEAASVSLVPSSKTLGLQEQFYVDVMLDTEGILVNGFEGSVNFEKDNISFVRAEEGSSMVNLWVTKPTLDGNKVKFSGIISNGFDGVIDPFNPKVKLPGSMIRLVFMAKNPSTSIISSSNAYVTLNDGLGTVVNIPNSDISLLIENRQNPYIYKTTNDVTPEIDAYVIRDPNLFNNKYTLVFDAKDRQTGIKEVLVKEGRRDWKKAESPYLLEDQSRHSLIAIQATNYSDASVSMSIEGIPRKLISPLSVSIVLFVLIILLLVVRKIYKLRNIKKIYEK